MKRKLRSLTEQLSKARSNYNRILGKTNVFNKTILNEQSNSATTGWHVWKGYTNPGSTMQGGTCTGGGSATIFASNLPGYVPGQNNAANNSSAASAANSLLFYQFLGSPAVGEFVQATVTGGGGGMGTTAPAPVCWEYIGPRSTPKTFSSGNIMTYGSTVNSNAGVSNPLGPFVDCTTCYGSTSCDTSTASPCAVQWWQNPNATWASNWITNRDCSNYTWPALNLETQADAIMATAPTPVLGPYNGWQDIWDAANNSGLVNPQKGQFIGKMAKSKYSQCQKVDCNC
mgnify:CR=1 FL=1